MFKFSKCGWQQSADGLRGRGVSGNVSQKGKVRRVFPITKSLITKSTDKFPITKPLITKSTDKKAETLKQLRSFLDAEEPQAVRWLVRLWNEQQAAVTYKELREAVLRGGMSEKKLLEWQKDYAKLVNTKLAPQWEKAIEEAAKVRMAEHPYYLYNFSVGAARVYIKQQGANLVTNLAKVQKDAIRQMVATAAHYDTITADSLSRLIRPVIGLTKPQAIANLNHFNAVKTALLEANPRMRQETAEKKAREAAAKYAARQHRYRAMNIARTELAMAYNHGGYGAVKDAQEQGFIGDCKKIWLTADDERVCPVCGGLDGESVKMEAEFSIGRLLPPAHPSCRCAVAYEEIGEQISPSVKETDGTGTLWGHGPDINTTVNFDGSATGRLTIGRTKGKIGDTDGYTRIDDIREIDISDKNTVLREIKSFFDRYGYADIEHSLVITTEGDVYELSGTIGTVNPEIIGNDELIGSIGVHNHPVLQGCDRGDSFSWEDLRFSARHRTGIEYLISGKRRDAFLYTGTLSERELYEAYQKAKFSVYERAWMTGVQIEWEKADIMRELTKMLGGYKFYENL